MQLRISVKIFTRYLTVNMNKLSITLVGIRLDIQMNLAVENFVDG